MPPPPTHVATNNDFHIFRNSLNSSHENVLQNAVAKAARRKPGKHLEGKNSITLLNRRNDNTAGRTTKSAGTLARCCNPSRGALLFGWVQGTGCWLGHSQPQGGGRHKASVLLYHSATVPGRWKGRNNEARSIACQVQHQVALVECKVTSLSLEEDVASFPSLFHVKIDLCHVSILVCWFSIIVMW